MKKNLVFYLIALILVYFLYTNVKVCYYNVKYSYEIKKLRKDIASEKIHQGILTRQLKEAKEDRYIEEKARTILGLVKQGEVAYQIIGKRDDRK